MAEGLFDHEPAAPGRIGPGSLCDIGSILRIIRVGVKRRITIAGAVCMDRGGVIQQVNVMIDQGNEIRVLKLKETHPEEMGRASDAQTMFRIWSLLGGQAQMRDRTICNRVLG